MEDTQARTTILEAKHISKGFPGVQALDDVSVQITKGTCHALVGENGAGKSTLGKIFAGLYQPDRGELLLDGNPVHFASPLAAMRAGVGLVHQELAFCENLTVAENLSLDQLPSRFGFVSRGELQRRAESWLSQIAPDINPRTVVGDLAIGKQQLVQIAGALGKGSRVLIFDEPTSSLSQHEAERLFSQIRKLKADGITCIYVSHRLDEIFDICDVVTVLRDGKQIDTRPIGELTKDTLVQKMIGREVNAFTRHELTPGSPLLQVSNLTSPNKFSDIAFSVHKGEILGIAGLVGSGRTEILSALFGLDPNSRGDTLIHGNRVEITSPQVALRHLIGFVPEDRKREGLVLGMNVRENITLPILPSLATAGWVRKRAERQVAQSYFDQLGVRAPGLESGTEMLSGGNQQKLVIARWLAAKSDLLLLDEPTRGVDVGAKAEIFSIIRDSVSRGAGVILVTSELPELLALSTRILVLHEGRIVGEQPGSEATEESIMRLMAGLA
ncbi:MAG: sugar ABC transporter ATP-binding protein [Fimbriimonadales bacterium]